MTTTLNDLVRYRREPVWDDPHSRCRAIAASEGYTLHRTRGGWLVQGHQWHSRRDISREYASHASSGRGETAEEAIDRWHRRAVAIGRGGKDGGLTPSEADAIAADLEQQVEAAADALTDGEPATVSVSVSASDSGLAAYKARAEIGPWRAMVYFTADPATHRADVAAQIERQLRDHLPLAAAPLVVVGEDDVPDDARRVVEFARVLREGRGTVYRRSDGAAVEVTGMRTVYVPTHPSCSGGGTHVYYWVGETEVHATDMRRLYR